jgi:hypothetical protein
MNRYATRICTRKSSKSNGKLYETFRIWQSKYEIATASATVLLA